MKSSDGTSGPIEALFRFRELDDSVNARLDLTLAELPVVDPGSSAGSDVLSSGVLTRRECVSMLLTAIARDYAANISQEPREPWSFDYVAELAGTTLSVMTRLSAKADDSMGSIFYGASIVRIGSDSYAIRSDFS